MTKTEIASALREARIAALKTQRQVGEALGFTPSSAAQMVQRWETGALPDWERLVAWAAAVECEVVVTSPGCGGPV